LHYAALSEFDEILGQVAYVGTAIAGDSSAVRLGPSGKYPEQRRFARSVIADKACSGTVGYPPVYIFENGLFPEGDRNIVYVNQMRALPSVSVFSKTASCFSMRPAPPGTASPAHTCPRGRPAALFHYIIACSHKTSQGFAVLAKFVKKWYFEDERT
jgi:hypothetical protein